VKSAGTIRAGRTKSSGGLLKVRREALRSDGASEQDRIIASTGGRDDEVADRSGSARKTSLTTWGSRKFKTKWRFSLGGAARGEALGPRIDLGTAVWGKTTLAHIIAND